MTRHPWMAWTVAGGLTLAACAGPPSAVAPPLVKLRFASAGMSTPFSPLGEELVRECERVLPGLEIEIDENEGATSNIEAVERGDADLAFAHADVAYLASVGRLERGRRVFTRLRGIAMLQRARVHVVTAPAAGIRRIEALRGRRISLGRVAPGLTPAARMVLAAHGIPPTAVTVVSARADDVVDLLTTGRVDALILTAADPLDTVAHAVRAGARLLPVEGPAIDRLRYDYPFFSRALIPADMYPGQARAVRTIGVDTVLLCRADLSEVLVHDLTQRLFQVLPLLSPALATRGGIDLDQAPATPVPLHEGAARYYRERELAR